MSDDPDWSRYIPEDEQIAWSARPDVSGWGWHPDNSREVARSITALAFAAFLFGMGADETWVFFILGWLLIVSGILGLTCGYFKLKSDLKNTRYAATKNRVLVLTQKRDSAQVQNYATSSIIKTTLNDNTRGEIVITIASKDNDGAPTKKKVFLSRLRNPAAEFRSLSSCLGTEQ